MLTAPPGVLCLHIFWQTPLSTPGMLVGVSEKMGPGSSWGIGKEKRPIDTKSDRKVASKETVITYKRKNLSTWRTVKYWTRDPTLKSLTVSTFKVYWTAKPALAAVSLAPQRESSIRDFLRSLPTSIMLWFKDEAKNAGCYSCIPLIHQCFPAHQSELQQSSNFQIHQHKYQHKANVT